jgi:RNA polymerase sigma-70 factor (ECF subfamily)
VSYLRDAEPPADFAPFKALRQGLGFVPGVYRAQTLLPRLIEVETAIAGAVVMSDGALPRVLKESILLGVAAAQGSAYCAGLHAETLRTLGVTDEKIERLACDARGAGLPQGEAALLGFCLMLAHLPAGRTGAELEGLRRAGFADEAILEAILLTSLARFLCTLSAGLGVAPDFEPPALPQSSKKASRPVATVPAPDAGGAVARLRSIDLRPQEFAPFAFFRDRFGFVPSLFRAQTLRRDVVEAEAMAVGVILLSDDHLSRVQKEYILLTSSAANLNTYCVAVHCELLRNLGIPEAVSDQIAVDHRQAELSPADRTLLDFTLRLSTRPAEFAGPDLDRLRHTGFTEEQILEAIVMTSMTQFLNTLQSGLGTEPDFEPRIVFQASAAKEANPFPGTERPTLGDPDSEAIGRVRDGHLEAFEALVLRHSPRIYRVIMGITGNSHDAEDGVQNTFLKVFEHLGDFRGESSFSTWLTRIAINEGVQRLRGRRHLEPLEETPFEGEPAEEEPFRPKQLAAWDEDPEKICAQTEFREILEREIMKLPPRYRMAVMLRDMEQLSAEESAAILDLGVPTLKTHLLRGRLMLREALAPLFIRPREGRPRV